MSSVTFRRALPRDIDALVALERDFPGDRLHLRSFRRFLTSDTAEVWVSAEGNRLLANAVVLFRRGAKRARLYSIIVAREARGRGLAAELVRKIEAAARRRGCERLCLEVRADNAAAITLYRKLGYETTRTIDGYYEDGQDALRLERRLSGRQQLAA